ncbi:MAG: ATP-binding protein [Flavobacteriaceae bacterium]|tara:strand:- start:1036 stop:2463 length:1428 start_codon:yes stop_codon:yes gene_type:complete
MTFLIKSIKKIKKRRLLSIFIFASIATILLLAYSFLEKKIDLEKTALILFILGVAQIFVLQYFFKNQLKNDAIQTNLNNRVDELNKNIETSNELVDDKSVYSTNMSYEIRTPLNTISGMLKMLKESDLDINQKAKVEIAEYSSQYLSQLVNMVTNNTDINTDTIKLNVLAMDLKSDLSELFKVFEYQAWEKELDFHFKFLSEKKSNFSLLGDSVRIKQVLFNLINNAVKFTQAGEVSVIVDQTIAIDDDQIVTFYIKDTGVGIRKEVVKEIFNNSKTLKKSMLKDYGGGGLGLSISRKLVELMGGELKLESKEDEGSTFYFSLQLKKTLNVKSEILEVAPLLQEKFDVLIAEDNRMNQKVIKFLLEKQGADCTFAKNGLEAVELYKILDFDMIFMDIYMPDMDGYEATKAIKNTHKHIKNKTPIIAVSASAFEEDIENAKLAGIDEFLAKPIDVLKLKKLLVKYAHKENESIKSI